MHDHNLDDLIIDNIEPKNRKTKSFLTIIALFIVVLIVAIILTRTLLKTPENDMIKEDDISKHIAPELKLQDKPKEAKKVVEPSLGNIIDEKIKTPEVEIEKKEIVIPKPEPIELPKIEEKIPAPVKAKKIEVPVLEKPVEKKPVVKKPTVAKPMQHYIQVGSFSKDPSKRFLSVIKNSGFKYQLTKANIKGIKKLHIGPYKTRADADVALKRVKDRINKSAFVIKK